MLRTARCIHYLASASPVDAFDRGPEWNLEMQQISCSTTPQPAAGEFTQDVFSNISCVLVKQILDLQETLEFYDLHPATRRRWTSPSTAYRPASSRTVRVRWNPNLRRNSRTEVCPKPRVVKIIT
jgi:hypothetical protein